MACPCPPSQPANGTLLGPLVGFVGVVCTLLWTYYQARATKRLKDKNDAAALAAALLAMIQGMYRIITGEIRYIMKDDCSWTWVPLLDFFEVYRENLGSVGLLSAAQSHALSDVYFSYKERAMYIARYGDVAITQSTIGTPVYFDFVKGDKDKRRVLEDLRHLAPYMERAISVLKDGEAEGWLSLKLSGVARLAFAKTNP